MLADEGCTGVGIHLSAEHHLDGPLRTDGRCSDSLITAPPHPPTAVTLERGRR